MDQLKDNQEASVILLPGSKSWVASRFSLIEEAGTCKRRCRFADCTKEYSRGTSHMILKRHWSRAHHDRFSDPSISLRAKFGSNKDSQITNQTNVVGSDFNKLAKKKPLKSNSQNLSSSLTKPSNNEKLQFDVKLVAKRLKEATSIHITFDVYTPKKGGKSYGIITAHSLSDSPDIKSVLLEYKHLPYPDDQSAIYEFLRACVAKFNIREKIVSIASNSSESVATAIQELDKRFRLSKNFNFSTVHIKCFPQFIHLNVLEVLRSQETLIDNVRKVVGFVNNNNFSAGTMQHPTGGDSTTTNKAANNSLTTGTKLPYDNRSSWNTTYTMIDTFIQQRGFIEPTLLCFHPQEMNNPQELGHVNIDWDRLFTLIQLLKPFHDVISKFTSDNYIPISLVAVSIPHLMDHLSSSSWAYDDLVMAAHKFKSHLESYRQLFQSDLTVIGGLLDPRVKDTFISPEGRDSAINILRRRIEDSSESLSHRPPSVRNEPHTSVNSLWSRIFREFSYDEVIDYLESPREQGSSSTVAYWEAHKLVYPNLYAIARALLCIQASSVPGDRMFSAAENTDRERKNQVDSTNSKELMKSWAKYLEK